MAFTCCDTITSIKIPSKVKTIGGEAFAYCRQLKKVTLNEGLKEVEYFAFNGCNKVKSITVPKSVKTSENVAFGCKAAEENAMAEDYEKVKGFVLKGYKGTEAEAYAKRTGIKFKAIK